MDRIRRYLPSLLALWIAFVFLQSLFFKFANAAEPQHIFGTLNQWAAEAFGVDGLFAPNGIFSQYVIGGAELVASLLLLVGVFLGRDRLAGLGGLLATAIMSGAIVFHLFTPLGVVIENQATGVESDGGTLFIMACLVWAAGLAMAWLYRRALPVIGTRFHEPNSPLIT